MTDRDRQRLVGVHPALVDAIRDVFAELDGWGSPLFVVHGVRTVAQQQALYAQGRTTPGRLVTYKDGVRHRSNHQPHADGFGYAVDCAFGSGDPFAETHPWERYGEALEARGVTWGGRWRMGDMPHAELPEVAGLKA